MGSPFQSGTRLGPEKTVSTGRRLAVCKMLLLVSVVAVGSLIANEQARSLPLPVLTGTSIAQLDAQAIQALLREVDARQKEADAKLQYYSYSLKRTEHQLNEQGVATKFKVHEYRVFPLGPGLPITALLIENGKELSPEKLAKEKARANKEWQKKKSAVGGRKSEIKKSEDGKTVSWFETLDFTLLPPERLEDRDVVVLSFRPRSELGDYALPKNADKFMSGLEGQIWIDPIEKVVLKVQGQLTTNFSAGGLSGWLSSLKPGTALTIEYTRLANGRWVVKRVDFSSIVKERGFLMLPQTSRFRLVDEMNDYRPVDPEATDLFAT